jgi:hypothetical protein
MAQTKYDIRITFQIAKAGKGFQEVQKEVAKTERVSKKATKNMFAQWTELRSKILVIKFAIREVANAFAGFWNTARGGAGLTQLTESFERANAEIFKVPTLLNDMSVSARGTVTQAELMSGIMTLTAGTSKELSQALTENAADLLTIAKAANRLNPSLGDTQFFYQSLTQGIKRSSYRILDNLGIVVRVGEANKLWAAQMGRTVDSMTAEERQIALLNNVLRVGGRLVEQAGGKADSLTDSYDILKTSVEEVANKLKQSLDEGVRPFAQALADAKLETLEFRAAILELFTLLDVNSDQFKSDLEKIEHQIQDFLEENKGGGLKSLIRWIFGQGDGRIDSETSRLITDQIARVFADASNQLPRRVGEIPPLLPSFLELSQLGDDIPENFRGVYDSINAVNMVAEDLGFTVTGATNDIATSGVVIEGQLFSYYDLINALILLQDSYADLSLNQTAIEFEGTARATIEASREAERLNAENARGVAILKALGADTKKYVEGMTNYVAGVADGYDGTQSLNDVLAGMGFTITDTTISMGDFVISFEELNKILAENEAEAQRVASTTDLLAASEEYATYAGLDYAKVLEVMALKSDQYADAAERAADAAQALIDKEIDEYFDAAVADGSLPLFNEELDELGKQLVFMSDSSVTHQAQVRNLQAEYDNIVDTINDYNTFAKGATLSDDERAEKLQEQYELLDQVGTKLADIGEIQGQYVELVKTATINEDQFAESLYNAIAAKSEDAEVTAMAGIALGEMTDGQAHALLQYALLERGIDQIADAWARGGKSAEWLRDQMRLLKQDVENLQTPFNETEEDADNLGTALDRAADMPEWKQLQITPPEVVPMEKFSFEEYMADQFGEDWKDATIELSSNADTLIEEELTPFQEALIAIETDSPYEADLDSNVQEEKTLLENYGLYLFETIDGATATVTVKTNYENSGQPGGANPYNPFPDNSGNGQFGFDGIVPPGFPNDSFTVGASTGERVTVQTAAQQRHDNSRSLRIENFNYVAQPGITSSGEQAQDVMNELEHRWSVS